MKKGEIAEGTVREIRFPNKGIVEFMSPEGEALECEVKNAIPGQKVRFRIAKKRGSRLQGALLEVTKPGPFETTPECPSYGKCGGCLYLPLPAGEELGIKEEQVRRLLSDAVNSAQDEDLQGLADTLEWFEGALPSPVLYGYRNKMEFSFGDEVKDGPLTLGMHKRGSFYDVTDAGGCEIADEDYRGIVSAARDFFAQRQVPYYHRMRKEGYLRHLLVRKASHTGQILIDLVTAQWTGAAGPEGAADPAEEELLKGFADAMLSLELSGEISGILHTRNLSQADIVRDDGTEVLYGRKWFEETLLGLRFIVTPFSFFQPNSSGAELLYSKARQFILEALTYSRDQDSEGRKPVIFDLYCGTGTIAQLMSPVADKVIGVEIVPEAVEAAKENALRNGIGNCEFIAGDVLAVLDEIETRPDLIILDPPRDGIHPKALPKILAYGVRNILYISCKPTSLARDLPYFIKAGYRPVRGVCVDQFVWTTGIETIVLLEKSDES